MQLLTPAPMETLLNYFIRGHNLPRPLKPESPLRLHPINDCCRKANATCGAYDRKPIHVETPLEVSLAREVHRRDVAVFLARLGSGKRREGARTP